MEQQNKKYRRFFLTKNNWTEADLERARKLMGSVNFGIIHFEKAPTTGTPHLHIGVHFKNPRYWSAIQKMKWSDIQIGDGRSTDEDWIKYGIEKDGKPKPPPEREPEIYGKPTQQGQRNDLNELKDEILNGRSIDDICVENPTAVHQYGRTLDRLEDIFLSKKTRSKVPSVHWYFGGTMKDRNEAVFANYNSEKDYVWAKGSKWQDGYAGQKNVIIAELSGEIPIRQLIELMGNGMVLLERRNRRAVPFVTSRIWITSDRCPLEIYKDISPETVRELQNIVQFHNFGTEVLRG